MTYSVTISTDAAKELEEQAKRTGTSPEIIAARILERSVRAVLDFRAISGPIGEAFAASGMTEDELSDLLEAEKHAMRAERRKKAS